MRMLLGLIFILVLAEEANSRNDAPSKRYLKIQNGLFVVRGSPAFLLGMTYFDALSASPEILESDIGFLKARGFNSVRVWATWHEDFQPRVVSLIKNNGTLNPEGVVRLKRVLDVTKRNGFLVDLVFSRDAMNGIGFTNYKTAIRNVAVLLKPYRFLLFDVQNETNHCGGDGDPKCTGHLSLAQVAEIRRAIKEVDPGRLVTASRNGEWIIPGKDDYLTFKQSGNLDFIATHRPSRTRDGLWAHYTDDEVQTIRSVLGPSVPILFDEPNRCGKNVDCSVSSAANLFITAARNARRSGAAGWFFHTQAGFRLSSRSLSFQLNEVERTAVDRIARAIAQ